MKRKITALFVIISLIGFISCSNQTSSDEDYTTYKVEVGVISNSTYSVAMNTIHGWTEVTYSNIATLRLYLYDNTISDHAIQTGITLSEIREFLLSKDFSNQEANTEIEGLKTIGNDILFFEYALDSNKTFWMYITK